MVDSLRTASSTVLPMERAPRPKRVTHWTLEDVHTHLRHAVNLEIWTIPYYLTVLYSIKDISHPVYRLIRSVANQEMLHAELAANVYNAFQPTKRLEIGPFNYTKTGGVPHLDFKPDVEARKKYGDPDAELGGLDLVRLSTMCLIELPECEPPSLDPHRDHYATLGDFYTALRYGMQQHAEDVRGNHNQVDHFASFYRNLSHTTVTKDGPAGLNQALELIDVITEQGEGRNNVDEDIPLPYQNTADGYDASDSHFRKFNAIRDAFLSGLAPETYELVPTADGTEPQRVLADNFEKLIMLIQDMFNGWPDRDSFGALMPTVGGNILACWRQGVVPQFSDVRSTT
jgi:hypothetical protein